jgi:hypothetical protein
VICEPTSLHYLFTETLEGVSVTLHVQVHQSHLRTIAQNHITRPLRTKRREEQYYCYRNLITDEEIDIDESCGNNPPTTNHTAYTNQHQAQSSNSPPTTPKVPGASTPNLQQHHAVYCTLSKGPTEPQQRSATGVYSICSKSWTYKQVYPPTRKLSPGKHLTLTLFIKSCYIKNKTIKLTLCKKLQEIDSFILIRTSNTKTSLTLSSLIDVDVAQKQSHEPHKALNLTGGGRGKRNSPVQHNQCHLQKLAKTNKTKQHKLSNTTYSSLYCSLYCSC